MNPTVSRIATTVVATGATLAARRGAEIGWRAVRGADPPLADELNDDADLRDLFLWSVMLVGTVLIARKLAASATRRVVG